MGGIGEEGWTDGGGRGEGRDGGRRKKFLRREEDEVLKEGGGMDRWREGGRDRSERKWARVSTADVSLFCSYCVHVTPCKPNVN